MTLLGGTTWRLAARMQEVRLIRNMAVQVIASVIFLNRGLLWRQRRPLFRPTISLWMK